MRIAQLHLTVADARPAVRTREPLDCCDSGYLCMPVAKAELSDDIQALNPTS